MSSVDELKSVLNEALENKGVVNELKSKLRAEVFTILEDNSFEKPKVSQENLLINELIREYMEFNHYKYSKSVFLKETNTPAAPLNREIISAELHIKEDKTSRQVPLLYSILWHFLNNETNSTISEMPSAMNNPYQSSTSNKFGNNSANDNKSKKISIYKYNHHDQLD